MKHLVYLFSAAAVLQVAVAQKIRVNFDPNVFRNGSTDGIAACKNGGPACDPTCRKTGLCILTSSIYEFRETSDCGDQYCNPTSPVASCSDTLQDCHPNIADHGCDTDGTFPDLYNCHNVIDCKKGNIGTSLLKCADDLAFDTCTGYCDVSLTNKTCYPQTAICDYSGQFGTIRDNDRLYYYCVEDSAGQLHPVVGRCSRGYFDIKSVSCTNSALPGCKNPDATPGPPTTPVEETTEYTDWSTTW